MTTASARTLLASLVDYAGLFPPAALPLEAAVSEYARWRAAPECWMLGRFVVPAQGLEALAAALPQTAGDPWRLSALVGAPSADLGAIARFNTTYDRALVDVVELKAATVADVAAALQHVRLAVVPYVEIVADGDLEPLLAAIRGHGARAKIRTGGVVPEAIPPCGVVARFLAACAALELPFKATAGLHHALRSEQPLSYEFDAPRAVMHGFVNVFAAAAFAHAGVPAAELQAVLEERDPSAFQLDDEGLGWRSRRTSTSALARCRQSFALSFGSCSFAEPVAELRAMGLVA